MPSGKNGPTHVTIKETVINRDAHYIMASLIKDKVKRHRGNLHVLCCTTFDICLLDAKHMIRLTQKP